MDSQNPFTKQRKKDEKKLKKLCALNPNLKKLIDALDLKHTIKPQTLENLNIDKL